MHWLWSAVPALVVACISSVPAQELSVNRAASGQPNTDIRVGVSQCPARLHIGSASIDTADVTA
jgi:hypothetical protein